MNASNVMQISVLAFAALMLLPALSGATSVMQAICNGTSTSNGIIPAAPIIGTGTQGVASVVGFTALILLTILLALSALYMVSQVAKLPTLLNFVKTELAEIVGTAIIVGIFFGGFYAAAFAATSGAQAGTTNPAVHFNGPARSVFVNDCAVLGQSSIIVTVPVFAAGIINYGIQFVTSVSFKITPGGFGFVLAPLSGMNIISTTLVQLQDIMSAFVIAILAMIFMLSLIYSIFPLLLYLGIILRAFPWTRAAGGIFIAMFIGFYIVFPLMLNSTLGGFGAALSQGEANYYNSSSVAGISGATTNSTPTIAQTGSFSSTGGTLSYIGNLLGSLVGYPNSYGVINGFIADFMGPVILIVVEIAISFVIALDFADLLSDILGAPSLSTEGLLGKVL